MKQVTSFESKQGVIHPSYISAVLDDIKFELAHCINDLQRPNPKIYGSILTNKQILAVLHWLHDNKDKKELQDYLELLEK